VATLATNAASNPRVPKLCGGKVATTLFAMICPRLRVFSLAAVQSQRLMTWHCSWAGKLYSQSSITILSGDVRDGYDIRAIFVIDVKT
jgi:hypothetical protein